MLSWNHSALYTNCYTIMFNFRSLKQNKCIPNNFIYTVFISVCIYVICMYIQIAYLYRLQLQWVRVTKHCHSPCDTETAETIGDMGNVWTAFWQHALGSMTHLLLKRWGEPAITGQKETLVEPRLCLWPLEITQPEPHSPHDSRKREVQSTFLKCLEGKC